jgi:hypothetical protein
MSNIDPRTETVLKKYCDEPKKAIWNCHGKWVAYHAALEEIARKAGITFDPPMILEADGANRIAAICVTGRMGTASEWSIGESSEHNYRAKGNQPAYPWAMAEKRAKDRVILKLIGLHGAVYSEEESDDFKSSEPAKHANSDGEKVHNWTVKGEKVHNWTVKADTKPLWVDGALKLIETASEFGELAEIQTANEKALNRLAETDPEAFARIETAIKHRHAQLFQAAE